MTVTIAIAGKICSGKTTIATALAKLLDCPRASFGDYVREVVANRELPPTRVNLQQVGAEILKTGTDDFCKAVLLQSGWIPGQSLVIDGLRHEETIEPIRQQVKPSELKIVFLSIDERTRSSRLAQRGDGDAIALMLADTHPSEYQANTTLAAHADLVINASQSIDEIVSEIKAWIDLTSAR
jgi:dephospho-CoA kinase